MGGQRHTPAVLPPRKTRYPLYTRLGGPSGPVWTDAENLASGPSCPVASCYTDWAIPAHQIVTFRNYTLKKRAEGCVMAVISVRYVC